MGLSEKYFVGNMTAAYFTGKLNISSGNGSGNYEKLSNKPRINGVELLGDRSFSELGFPDIPDMTGYARLSDIPSSLPARGGDADTVGGHTVMTDVPENAVFTDTVPDLSGYAKLTDIPSSLPANGGNADTVDGRHASEFVLASTSQQVMNSRVELPANVNVGEWLVKNAKIGTQYFRTDGAVGQTNLPGGLNTWMWFSYDGNRCFARAWTADNGTTEFVLNNVNAVGGWKEISTTPIKSTPFSGTTNEYGNVVFTAVGNKIPVFAECSPYCGTPLRFNDNYWIHCINPITANNSIVANTAVTGTVYYVEI